MLAFFLLKSSRLLEGSTKVFVLCLKFFEARALEGNIVNRLTIVVIVAILLIYPLSVLREDDLRADGEYEE